LSKAFSASAKGLAFVPRREFGSNPGILSKVLNTVDANTTAFKVVTHDTSVPLKGHKPI
jgi:hypothetical protein